MTERASGSVGLTTASARAILGTLDGPGSRAEQIARRLGQAIRMGLIADGDRLPPEAELAAQAGVATVTLRDALAALRREGLVVTLRGRSGGTFVRAPDPSNAEHATARLRSFTTQALRELGDHRLAISGAAAALAARRAIPDEVASLARIVDRLAAAASPSECERLDAQLSVEIAAAAQSSRLTREQLLLRGELGDLVWLGVTPEMQAAAVDLRRAEVDAIGAHDDVRARSFAERYVQAGTRRLLALRLEIYDVDAAP